MNSKGSPTETGTSETERWKAFENSQLYQRYLWTRNLGLLRDNEPGQRKLLAIYWYIWREGSQGDDPGFNRGGVYDARPMERFPAK